jgi:hypothetical protein
VTRRSPCSPGTYPARRSPRSNTTRAALAGTTGLRWKTWARGYYLVAYDGEQIGSVTPGRSSGPPHKVHTWRPSLIAGVREMPTTDTVTAAAHAVYEAKFGKPYREGNGD